MGADERGEKEKKTRECESTNFWWPLTSRKGAKPGGWLGREAVPLAVAADPAANFALPKEQHPTWGSCGGKGFEAMAAKRGEWIC